MNINIVGNYEHNDACVKSINNCTHTHNIVCVSVEVSGDRSALWSRVIEKYAFFPLSLSPSPSRWLRICSSLGSMNLILMMLQNIQWHRWRKYNERGKNKIASILPDVNITDTETHNWFVGWVRERIKSKINGYLFGYNLNAM